MHSLILWFLCMICISAALAGACEIKYRNGGVVICECVFVFLALLPFVSNILLK
jgi:hypothetical protein